MRLGRRGWPGSPVRLGHGAAGGPARGARGARGEPAGGEVGRQGVSDRGGPRPARRGRPRRAPDAGGPGGRPGGRPRLRGRPAGLPGLGPAQPPQAPRPVPSLRAGQPRRGGRAEGARGGALLRAAHPARGAQEPGAGPRGGPRDPAVPRELRGGQRAAAGAVLRRAGRPRRAANRGLPLALRRGRAHLPLQLPPGDPCAAGPGGALHGEPAHDEGRLQGLGRFRAVPPAPAPLRDAGRGRRPGALLGRRHARPPAGGRAPEHGLHGVAPRG